MRFPKTTVYTDFCHCSAFYSGGVEPDGGADRRTGPHATRPGAAGPHAGAGGLGRNEALATSRRRQGRELGTTVRSPSSVVSSARPPRMSNRVSTPWLLGGRSAAGRGAGTVACGCRGARPVMTVACRRTVYLLENPKQKRELTRTRNVNVGVDQFKRCAHLAFLICPLCHRVATGRARRHRRAPSAGRALLPATSDMSHAGAPRRALAQKPRGCLPQTRAWPPRAAVTAALHRYAQAHARAAPWRAPLTSPRVGRRMARHPL